MRHDTLDTLLLGMERKEAGVGFQDAAAFVLGMKKLAEEPPAAQPAEQPGQPAMQPGQPAAEPLGEPMDGPFTVPQVGIILVCEDPAGAVFSLIQPALDTA